MLTPTPPPADGTPSRRKLPLPSTPASGGVLGCSDNPADFDVITIHTAKCSDCDSRNMSKMRRCPKCTWQICEKCIADRNGDFKHGNMNSPATTDQDRPVRRRTPFGFGGTLGTTVPAPVKAEDVANEGVASAGVQPSSPTPTPKRPASSGKRKAKKGKTKGKLDTLTSEEEEEEELNDDDFRPAGASPTPGTLKRRKLENSAEGSPTRRLVRPALFSVLVPPGEGVNNRFARQLLTPPQPDRQQTDHSVVHMIKERGVNYTEHPLKRAPAAAIHFPVMHIPSNIARNFEHGPSAEEIQRNIQDKVRFKLWGGESAAKGGSSGTLSGSEHENAPLEWVDGPSSNTETTTVREFADAEYEKRRGTAVLDDDQHNALKNVISEAARKCATKFFKSQSMALREIIKHSGLSMEMKYLSDTVKEDMAKGIKAEADRVLKEFEEEAGLLNVNSPLMSAPPLGVSLASARPQTMSPPHDSGLSVDSHATSTTASEKAGVERAAHSYGSSI